MSIPRVGVICSLVEKKWPSMDTVAQMLLKGLGEGYSEIVTGIGLWPPRQRRARLFAWADPMFLVEAKP